MMAMVELFQQAVQFAAESGVLAYAEDLSDLVRGQAEHPQFCRALKELVDGEIAPEDKIQAVLDLVQGVVTAQVDGGAVLLGELGSQDPGPVVQARADDFGTESIGSCLQCWGVGDPEKGIVILAESDALVLQLASDEGMPINPIAGLEGEKRADAQDHGAEHFIADVEVVVGIVGRVLGQAGMESGARFHAFEDEVDAEALPTFHGAKIRSDVIFLSEAFLLHVFIGPAEGNTVVTREGFDPMLVVSRSLPQRLFSNGIDAVHVAEEMDDMLRTSEQGEIALDDDAIKTVVYKSEQAGKQLAEGFHRSSFPV